MQIYLEIMYIIAILLQHPYHDTFDKVFVCLDMAEFRQAFFRCVEAIRCVTDGQVVAIDGKTIRCSFGNNAYPIHMVSTLAHKNRMLLER